MTSVEVIGEMWQIVNHGCGTTEPDARAIVCKKIKQNKIKIKLIVDPDLYLTERRVREKTLGRA